MAVFNKDLKKIWAALWQNQQSDCAPSEDSDQSGHPPFWSESSLSAWRKFGSIATHWVHSEDSDQTGRMPRLIWVFAGRTVTFLVLSCRGSYSRDPNDSTEVTAVCNMSRIMTKPTKWVCAQRRLRSAWASIQSDQSRRCPSEESWGP